MKNKVFYKKLGKRIKELRKDNELTQEQLAEKSGLSLDFVGKIEVAISKPSLDSIVAISKALDVNVASIFSFED